MAKAIFQHKPDGIYDDVPWERYEFPRQYRRDVEAAIGDWVIFYEPRSADGGRGRLRYFATARVQRVLPSPNAEGWYYAMIDMGSYQAFARPVGRFLPDGTVIERRLREADGSLRKGGNVQRAVRPLDENEFETILRLGLDDSPEPWEAAFGMEQEPAPFERPIIERLTTRPKRDPNFRKQVLAAYEYRCAISGLGLRNGFDRPEVEAAHIRPVEDSGPDTVKNGLALSGTLHWMFDRGLITVAADQQTILVSENKVPRDVIDRLINPDRRLRPPLVPRDAPHPAFLDYHRQEIFGRGPPMDDAGRWAGPR